MEWAHRVLGRLLGVVFVAPLVYFAATKKISFPLAIKLGVMGLLIGAQGALGWYMVQSGLDDGLLTEPGAVPRVSQYRLAAHLGLALALYAGMFWTGVATIKDWKYASTPTNHWNKMRVDKFMHMIRSKEPKRLLLYAQVLTGLVFLTALSGVCMHCLRYMMQY